MSHVSNCDCNVNLFSGGDGPSTYTTQYAILDEEERFVKEYPAKEMRKPGASSIIMSGLNVITLPRGLYTFQVRVRDNDSDQEIVAHRSFQVLKPVSTEEAKETSAAFTKEVAERNLDFIKYITSKEEQKMYKELNLEGKSVCLMVVRHTNLYPLSLLIVNLMILM